MTDQKNTLDVGASQHLDDSSDDIRTMAIAFQKFLAARRDDDISYSGFRPSISVPQKEIECVQNGKELIQYVEQLLGSRAPKCVFPNISELALKTNGVKSKAELVKYYEQIVANVLMRGIIVDEEDHGDISSFPIKKLIYTAFGIRNMYRVDKNSHMFMNNLYSLVLLELGKKITVIYL
jgi:hypothetical protein